MSTLNGGPGNIVTNGLVMYLDAANYASYTSGSTVWRDLTNNINNFNLINGPTFDSRGWLSLDGTDDRIQITSSTSLTLGTNDFTLDIWVYPLTLSTYPHLFVLGSVTNGDINGFTLKAGRQGDGDGRVYFYAGQGIFETFSTISGASIVINTWNNITLTKNGTTVTIFKNGISGGSKSGLTINFGNLRWSIGNPPGSSEMAAKNVSNVKIYNRALTSLEIQQNYNAQKTRFGLT